MRGWVKSQKFIWFGVVLFIIGFGVGSVTIWLLKTGTASVIELISAVALIIAALSSAFAALISRRALDIASYGPPLNIDIKIRKGDADSPFVILVTNLWHKKVRPLQIILEIKDRFGEPIPSKGSSKHDDFRIRFKNQWLFMDDKYIVFDIIKPISRHTYPLKMTDGQYAPPDIENNNEEECNENRIIARSAIYKKLKRAVKETGAREFTLFAGVEVPGDQEFFSSEHFIIKFEGIDNLMTLQHIGKEVQKHQVSDLYYLFHLDKESEIKYVKFSGIPEYWEFRDKALEWDNTLPESITEN